MDLLHLTAWADRYSLENGGEIRELPGLSIFRRDAPSEVEAVVYQPVISLILQGSKSTAIGDRTVRLRPGDALLVSHALPVVSRITEASRAQPYLALILDLDFELLRGLHAQLGDALPRAGGPARALAAATAEPGWLAPLGRYIDLAGHPLDVEVLGPGLRREIHYRLLLSPIGSMLRDLLRADSHGSRVAEAIRRLRAGFRAPLSVPELAREAGMSPSSFHAHFKAVTGTTPLQYQKDLRLIEAKALLRERQSGVSEAAFSVGYESPTHFSRDYRRKFGRPPSRDGQAEISGSARLGAAGG
ncbi:MAG: AraC family transcriptional regulator [Maritimibacter sp.]|nr:AraC family transcriptional regulator [Maritimibacter sp.]